MTLPVRLFFNTFSISSIDKDPTLCSSVLTSLSPVIPPLIFSLLIFAFALALAFLDIPPPRSEPDDDDDGDDYYYYDDDYNNDND
jgi:hypothetical protein